MSRALPLGASAEANKPRLRADNLGSTSLILGQSFVRMGFGTLKNLSLLSPTCQEAACVYESFAACAGGHISHLADG